MLIYYEKRGPKCRVLVKNKGNFEAEKRREENAWVSVISIYQIGICILFSNQLYIVFCTYHLHESALNNYDTNVGKRYDQERKKEKLINIFILKRI